VQIKLSYSSGIATEIVTTELTPMEYINSRFGHINELRKLGGNYSIIEDSPVSTIDEIIEIAPIQPVEITPIEEVLDVTGPYTVKTAVDDDA
jgi:hypothetical protein